MGPLLAFSLAASFFELFLVYKTELLQVGYHEKEEFSRSLRNIRIFFVSFPKSGGLSCPGNRETTELKITPGGSCEEELWEADRRCLNGRCEDAVYLYDRFLERDDACHGDLRGDAFSVGVERRRP